jgi:hypothetical protein
MSRNTIKLRELKNGLFIEKRNQIDKFVVEQEHIEAELARAATLAQTAVAPNSSICSFFDRKRKYSQPLITGYFKRISVEKEAKSDSDQQLTKNCSENISPRP